MHVSSKKSEYRLLWPFYVTALVSSSFSVAIPVWIIFFREHFSFLQISFALSLQSIAAILLEIPSGAVADIIGRKACVVTGIVLQGVLWLCLPFIADEAVLYVAFFLAGISRTLESGADKAWMVDWLKENRRGKLVREMFLKIHSLHSAGTVISSLLASILLFSQEIRFLFFVQGSGYVVESLILLFFAKESVHRGKKVKLRALIWQAVTTTRKGVCYVVGQKPLRWLLVATTFAVCSKDFGSIAWQPLLVNVSLPVERMGLVFSAAGLLGIAAPFLAKLLSKRLGGEGYFLSAATLAEFMFLCSLCFLQRTHVALGVGIYLLAMFISDLQLPIMSSCFQSLIPSKIRATVASVQSVVFALFSLLVTAVGSGIMDRYGPGAAIAAVSVLLLPAAAGYLGVTTSSLQALPVPSRRRPGKNRLSLAGQWWVRHATWIYPPDITYRAPAVVTPCHIRKFAPCRCFSRKDFALCTASAARRGYPFTRGR